jgi:hypothetical protein
MSALPLPDELLLFGLDDAVGKPVVPGTVLDLGLAGAVLVELALAERIAVQDGLVVVTGAGPMDDPIVEQALDRLRSSEQAHPPQHWVHTLAEGLRDRILDRLVAGGIVERTQTRVLGLFGWVRYPLLNPAPETAAQFRLDDAVRRGLPPSQHTAALAALIHAVDLGPQLYPDLPAAQVNAALDQIAAGEWAGAGAKASTSAIQVAIGAAATAVLATTSAVAGSLA